jgi:hypothetical protein
MNITVEEAVKAVDEYINDPPRDGIVCSYWRYLRSRVLDSVLTIERRAIEDTRVKYQKEEGE